jgi:hypothetical protein
MSKNRKYIKEKDALKSVDKSSNNRSSLETALLSFRGGESKKNTFSKTGYKFILDTIKELVTLQIKHKAVDTKLSSNIARKLKSNGINCIAKQSGCNHSPDTTSLKTYDNLLVPLQNPNRI